MCREGLFKKTGAEFKILFSRISGWVFHIFYYVIRYYEINMEIPELRTWIMFYLISFVGLLWAAFLSVQGIMLWVSLFLVIVIVGINFFTVYNQLKLRASRKEMLRNLVQGFERGPNEEDAKKAR